MRQSRRLGALRRSRTALQAPLVGSTWPMRIARTLLDEIISHAREDAPNECCGMVAGTNGEATRVYPARNAEASPFRYAIHPQDQIRIMTEIEGRGEGIAAIYHSHTKTAAEPSQTDINLAENWPDPVYLICSLADPDDPKVRGFVIRRADVKEVELDVP
jgi:proteasome lid subunit RPN8/RPN11